VESFAEWPKLFFGWIAKKKKHNAHEIGLRLEQMTTKALLQELFADQVDFRAPKMSKVYRVQTTNGFSIYFMVCRGFVCLFIVSIQSISFSFIYFVNTLFP
jgi:hypothetical protein